MIGALPGSAVVSGPQSTAPTAKAQPSPSASFAADVLAGPEALLRLLETTQAAATPFQGATWLKAQYATLAPARDARPHVIRLTEQSTGTLAMLLPLTVQREGRLTLATFPDFGVTDYGGPILGPAAPTGCEGAAALWTAVKSALDGVDLVRLTSMPETLAGRPNPLALQAGTTPARHSAHTVTLTGTVEEFLVSRGKKYRKEAERCRRLWEKEGPISFQRATTPDDIAAAYAVLEAQQRTRRLSRGSYALDDQHYSRFYRDVLEQGATDGTAHIFTIGSGDETIAALLGISDRTSFVLLRISTAGERWQRMSPGRLVVLETMRYFLDNGIRTFDMGIGDYAFKDGFGAETRRLVDLVQPLTWKAAPHILLRRLKHKARQSQTLSRLAQTIRKQK